MPRSHAAVPPLVAAPVRRALTSGWNAVAGNPLATLVVVVQWFVGFVGTVLAFQWFLWDWLRTDLIERKLPPEYSEVVDVVVVTPFDVIAFQAKVGAIVGVLLVAPSLAYYARGWLSRRRVDSDEPLPADATTQAVLAVVAGVVLIAVATYQFVTQPLLTAAEANAAVASLLPRYSILQLLEFVTLVGLSVGIAAIAPFVVAALARAGVVRPETIVGDVTRVGLVAAAFGLLAWPVAVAAQIAWLAPLALSLSLSVGICRVVARDDGPRPVP